MYPVACNGAGFHEGQSVLSSVFDGFVERSADEGVTGLMDVLEECGESGLVPFEDVERGLAVLARASAPLRPWTVSWYSAGLGFHEERWKLFFLRTLALYAARIAEVASCVLMLSELTADDTLGARLRGGDVEVVISRRGSWVGEIWVSKASGE